MWWSRRKKQAARLDKVCAHLDGWRRHSRSTSSEPESETRSSLAVLPFPTSPCFLSLYKLGDAKLGDAQKSKLKRWGLASEFPGRAVAAHSRGHQCSLQNFLASSLDISCTTQPGSVAFLEVARPSGESFQVDADSQLTLSALTLRVQSSFLKHHHGPRMTNDCK